MGFDDLSAKARPLRTVDDLSAAEREELASAPARARHEGWQPHEIREYVCALERKLRLRP